MRKNRWLFCFVLVVFAAVASLGADSPELALRQDAEAYAAKFGVSVDEASRRLVLQRAVSELDGAVAGEEASYAGLWIQHEPEYRVVARFTDRAAEARLKARVAGTPLEKLLELRPARFTLTELEKKQQEVRAHSRKAGADLDLEVDVVNNAVRLYTLDPEKTKAKLGAAKGRIPEGVVLKKVNQLTVTDTIIPGGAPLSSCTAGYGVIAANGELGISTGGHCSDTQYYNGYYLPLRAQKDSGDQDVQWHSVCDIIEVTNEINTGIGLRAITSTRTRTSQTIGTWLCKFGSATGRTCGTLSSRTFDPGSSHNATFMRVDGINLRGPGDSGAPWFVEDIAYGIHRGAPGDDLNDATFMAINYISAIGVSVLTYNPGANCNIAPNAMFFTDVPYPQYAVFDASSSNDPDGFIVTYDWDFGDGWTEQTTTPYAEHYYDASGPFMVQLVVTDNEGKQSSWRRPISPCAPYVICPY